MSFYCKKCNTQLPRNNKHSLCAKHYFQLTEKIFKKESDKEYQEFIQAVKQRLRKKEIKRLSNLKGRKKKREAEFKPKLPVYLGVHIASKLKGNLNGKADHAFLKRPIEWIIGCNTEIFIKHLEKRYRRYYGIDLDRNLLDKGLQIDHILPLSIFDLYNEEDFLMCNHYSNLRIITKSENSSKKDKIIYKFRWTKKYGWRFKNIDY